MNIDNTETERLTHREQKFVAAFLEAPTHKAAALSAGYLSNPSSQASRLLRRPRVRKAILHEREQLMKYHKIDRNSLAENLLSAYSDAHQEKDVMGMIRAVRELGLLCGLYDAAEPSNNNGGVDLSSMSDRELERMISPASKPTAQGS